MREERLKVQNYPKFQEQLGISRTRFYRLLKEDPTFPKPFEIGGRKVFYVNECDDYVRRCAEATQKKTAALS